MANISKIKIGQTSYSIKDAQAREDISSINSEISGIKSSVTGAMKWLGYTTTALVDGSTTNPVSIDSENVTAKAGDVVAVVGSGVNGAADKEFVFSGTKWQEFGSTGSLKSLAFSDSASGSVTAAGSNAASAVSFSGQQTASVISAIDSAAVAPSFTEGEFNAGTLPSLGAATTSAFATEGVTATYGGEVGADAETLLIGAASTSNAVTAQGTFSAGTLPSKAADSFSAGSAATFSTVDVISNIGTATAAAQTFTGSAVNVTVSAA